jgi:histidinol-phosphate aminotransferase
MEVFLCVERKKMKRVQSIVQPRAMKKLYALAEKRPIDLSLSENPLGCSLLVIRALNNMEIDFSAYPSPNGKLLKRALATKFSLLSSNFFIANGSESIINDLPRVVGRLGDEVVVPKLTFPMFSVCSELAGKKVMSVEMTNSLGIDLGAISKAVTTQTSLVFICNPNNPTGSVLPKEAILQLLERIPKNVMLVVDEANIEFGGKSMIDEVRGRENLIVLRTFSKGFGLASLRVGFAVASEALVQKIEEQTPIFQMSGISEQLSCIALLDDVFLQKTKKATKDQRMFLRVELEKLGCIVFPSEANNLFVKLPSLLSPNQFVAQLEKKGVSVVLGTSFDGFDNSFFRVSVRESKTNILFIQKMKEIVEKAM